MKAVQQDRSYEINLISADKVPVGWGGRKFPTAMLGLGVIFLCMLWGVLWGVLYFQVKQQQLEIDGLQRSSLLLADDWNQSQIVDMKKELADHQVIIDEVKKGIIHPSEGLALIQAAAPPGLVLEDISLEVDQVVCKGVAMDMAQLTDYMLALEMTAILEPPVCRCAENTLKGVEFELMSVLTKP